MTKTQPMISSREIRKDLRSKIQDISQDISKKPPQSPPDEKNHIQFTKEHWLKRLGATLMDWWKLDGSVGSRWPPNTELQHRTLKTAKHCGVNIMMWGWSLDHGSVQRHLTTWRGHVVWRPSWKRSFNKTKSPNKHPGSRPWSSQSNPWTWIQEKTA